MIKTTELIRVIKLIEEIIKYLALGIMLSRRLNNVEEELLLNVIATFMVNIEIIRLKPPRIKQRIITAKFLLSIDLVMLNLIILCLNSCFNLFHDDLKSCFSQTLFMKVLVTGGAGRMGNVLVRNLIQQKYEVMVLILPHEDISSIKGLNVKLVEGNILDYELLKKIMKGIDYVFHLASMISIVSYNKDKVMKVNVEGTENVINACLENNVKRLVYVSTIHSLHSNNKTINESSGFNINAPTGVYDKSKAIASLKVMKAVESRKLDAIIVCPTGLMGPYDYQISSFGKYIIDYVKKKLFFYLDGSYDFVDVRDVTSAMIKLLKKAKKGEVFILSGQDITIKEFNQVLFKETKIKPPMKIPFTISYLFSFLSQLYYRISKKTPVITPYAIMTLRTNTKFSHKKAKKLINYSPRSFKNHSLTKLGGLKRKK